MKQNLRDFNIFNSACGAGYSLDLSLLAMRYHIYLGLGIEKKHSVLYLKGEDKMTGILMKKKKRKEGEGREESPSLFA